MLPALIPTSGEASLYELPLFDTHCFATQVRRPEGEGEVLIKVTPQGPIG